MNLTVIGTRRADGKTHLVFSLPVTGEHPITPRLGVIEGWDGKWDWGNGGLRAAATAIHVWGVFERPKEEMLNWLNRFVADWMATAPRSRFAITAHELEDWLARETAKDLVMLGQGGAGQGG